MFVVAKGAAVDEAVAAVEFVRGVEHVAGFEFKRGQTFRAGGVFKLAQQSVGDAFAAGGLIHKHRFHLAVAAFVGKRAGAQDIIADAGCEEMDGVGAELINIEVEIVFWWGTKTPSTHGFGAARPLLAGDGDRFVRR